MNTQQFSTSEVRLLRSGLKDLQAGKTRSLAAIRLTAKIESSLRVIRDSMKTHEDWARFQEGGGKAPKSIGDAPFHRATLKEYRKVLSILLLAREASLQIR